MSDRDALLHDAKIMHRDSILHGNICYIRSILAELGHPLGAEDFYDDIIARANLLLFQLTFCMDHTLHID